MLRATTFTRGILLRAPGRLFRTGGSHRLEAHLRKFAEQGKEAFWSRKQDTYGRRKHEKLQGRETVEVSTTSLLAGHYQSLPSGTYPGQQYHHKKSRFSSQTGRAPGHGARRSKRLSIRETNGIEEHVSTMLESADLGEASKPPPRRVLQRPIGEIEEQSHTAVSSL